MTYPKTTRKNKATGKWKSIFIAALEESPNVYTAAIKAGVCRAMVYKARAQDEKFRDEWDDAIQNRADQIEGLTLDLALNPDPKHNMIRLASLRRYKAEWRETTNQNLNHDGSLALSGGVTLYIPDNGREPREPKSE